jgi:hypothetical protein
MAGVAFTAGRKGKGIRHAVRQPTVRIRPADLIDEAIDQRNFLTGFADFRQGILFGNLPGKNAA